jgi:hypothetical protein
MTCRVNLMEHFLDFLAIERRRPGATAGPQGIPGPAGAHHGQLSGACLSSRQEVHELAVVAAA